MSYPTEQSRIKRLEDETTAQNRRISYLEAQALKQGELILKVSNLTRPRGAKRIDCYEDLV